ASYWLLEAGLAFCPSLPFGTRVQLGGWGGARIGNVRKNGGGFNPCTEGDRPLGDAVVGAPPLLTTTPPVFPVVGLSAGGSAPRVPRRGVVRVGARSSDCARPPPAGGERPRGGAERPGGGAGVGAGPGCRFSPKNPARSRHIFIGARARTRPPELSRRRGAAV